MPGVMPCLHWSGLLEDDLDAPDLLSPQRRKPKQTVKREIKKTASTVAKGSQFLAVTP